MQGKVKHLMSDIIMICFLAILARCDGWDEIAMFAKSKEEWLNKFLELQMVYLLTIQCKE